MTEAISDAAKRLALVFQDEAGPVTRAMIAAITTAFNPVAHLYAAETSQRVGKTERAAQQLSERWKRGDRTPVVVYGHALDLVAPELLDEVGARIADKGDFRLVTFDDRGDEDVARADGIMVRALDERGIPLLIDLRVPLSVRELMMSIDVAGRNVEVQDIGFDASDMLTPRKTPVQRQPGYLQHDPTKQMRRRRGKGRR